VLQCGRDLGANSQNDIGRERDQLCRVFASEIGVAQRQAGLDLQVAIFDPPQLIETVIECRNPRSRFKVILRDVSDYANTPHALWRLRPRPKRPRSRCAPEERDEFAAGHSMTSSDSASSCGGTSRPSDFAVLRFITRAAKARGKRLGNPKLSDARRHATAARKERADRYSANVLPIIREIQRSGIHTLRGIARALAARGIPTARGGMWTAVQVSDILRRMGWIGARKDMRAV
jgi:Recombinase